MNKKIKSGGEWYCGKGQDVWSILNIECFQIASISMAAGLFFDPIEMNPLIRKTRAV